MQVRAPSSLWGTQRSWEMAFYDLPLRGTGAQLMLDADSSLGFKVG